MSQDLQVGDIIRIYDNEIIPADCVLLVTHSKASEDGIAQCFTNTQQLDGETNLKPKIPIKQLEALVKSTSDAESAAKLKNIVIKASHPDADLYKFTGEVNVGTDHNFELDLKQFLHRGSSLKNSNYVDAMVIYTGIQTKIVMN